MNRFISVFGKEVVSLLNSKTRRRDVYYFRCILANYYHDIGLKPPEIAKLVGRDRTTVIYYLKQYLNEYRFNPQFRYLADKIKTPAAPHG